MKMKVKALPWIIDNAIYAFYERVPSVWDFDEALIRCINVSLSACALTENSNTMMVFGFF